MLFGAGSPWGRGSVLCGAARGAARGAALLRSARVATLHLYLTRMSPAARLVTRRAENATRSALGTASEDVVSTDADWAKPLNAPCGAGIGGDGSAGGASREGSTAGD